MSPPFENVARLVSSSPRFIGLIDEETGVYSPLVPLFFFSSFFPLSPPACGRTWVFLSEAGLLVCSFLAVFPMGATNPLPVTIFSLFSQTSPGRQ